MKQKYNVLIIGAGNIGAFFDNPESDNILSHAHAFVKHDGFNLVGFIDNDISKARKAASMWGGKAFKNISEAFGKGNIDVAVIAVPDDLHYYFFKDLFNYQIKVIFAEKPIAKSVVEAEDILRNFKDRNTDIIVNYTRRFVPEFEKIKCNIQNGLYGEYLTGAGYYGKGLLHNGSHLLDLLMFFLGDIKKTFSISRLEDFYEDDNSISAILTFANGKSFFLQNLDCRRFTIFELDMFFEKKRIRIYDLGFRIEEYDVLDSKVFNGYRNILKTGDYGTSLNKAIFYAVENIYKNLSEGQALKCTAHDGYKALKAVIDIRKNFEFNIDDFYWDKK